MHNYFCPECGATLDPGERCTCIGFRIKEKAPTVAAAGATEERTSVIITNKSITQPKEKASIFVGTRATNPALTKRETKLLLLIGARL